MKVNLINPNYTSDYVRHLLEYRGVEDFNEYLHPTEKFLQDPENLDNVQEAYELVMKSLALEKPIALVVDCDCDGFTSAAITYLYLKDMNPNVEICYFLHEHKGHGLQDLIYNIIETDKDWGLVITPDAGTNDMEYHEMFKSMGIPVLVMDHHELDSDITSENCVIVNNQTSANYENKDLTGAGVAWQVCRYIDKVNGTSYANKYIDLVALGVCGDMGSVLSMENRYIMYEGFSKINNGFFNALIEKQSFSMKNEINPMTVAFYIVPLINSIVRVGTMLEKEHMFMSFIGPDVLVESHKRGANGTLEKVSVETLREATNARTRQNKILDSLEEKMEIKISKYDLLNNKILFIRLDDDDDFPAEINGLLAMRLTKRYKKPAVVARLNDKGMVRGSARGLDACELKDLKQFFTESGLFEYAQGHANAHGISISNKNIEKLHEYANETLKNIDFGENVYDISFERIAADEDIEDLIMEIGKYPEVWGTHNPTPLICVKDILVSRGDLQIMGSKKNTVKIIKGDMTYIKFNAEKMIKDIEAQDGMFKLTVAGTANINEWNGNFTPQLIIEGYEIVPDNGF